MTPDDSRGIPGQPVAADLPRRKESELFRIDTNIEGETVTIAAHYFEDVICLHHRFTGPRALEAAAAYAMQLLLDEQYRREE